jgi:RNase P/RNase MRP subunit p30
LKFLDLHTHSLHSTGTDTPERMLHQARELGIGIGLCDGISHGGDRFISGTELAPGGPRELKKALLGKHAGYILVRAGGEALNRAAVGDRRVAALVGLGEDRRDMTISPVVAKKAAETGVSVEVNLGALISTRGLQRVQVVRGIKQTLVLKRKFGFSIIASTGADSHMGLRGADLAGAILLSLGFTDQEVEEALSTNPWAIVKGERP